MADLITHISSALLLKAAFGRRHTASFTLGNVLPDLLGRVPGMALVKLASMGLPVPEGLTYAPGVLHMPFGMLPLSVLLALAFPERQRLAVAANLFGGCMLHLGIDLLQHHTGTGYPLLFPFSSWHWELAWIGTEATVLVAPVLAPLSVLAFWARGRWDARRAPATLP
ncbi:MAG: hypothetical protein VX899_24395 [Myxococcota bacterium]|nr:hypothetical protein [Myxococcota bacterium]